MTELNDACLIGFVTLNAKAIGLPIAEEYMPAVLASARILAGHAAEVMACPLPPETPNATDFQP